MGRHFKPDKVTPYQLAPAPLRLKGLTLDCDIKQAALAEAANVSRPTINLCINKGYIPDTRSTFKPLIEQYIGEHSGALAWLEERGLTLSAIWQRQDELQHRAHPPCTNIKTYRPAMIPGDPDTYNQEETQMKKLRIPEKTLKYFKLFRDPFFYDPRSEKEVFRSEDHRYLEYAMYDAATNNGLLAVIAEVGAGKTVMRREVIERLKSDEKVRLVYPQIVDNKKVSAASICDAIVMDLSNDKVKRDLECKSRHVRALLCERLKQGKRVCLIIEEAHQLTVPALKYIKRFYEFEEGRQKLISILLLGQIELATLLDEEQYPELRELSRRIQVASIPGLGDNTWDYLTLKFSIVGGDITKIISEEAVKALVKRLTIPDPVTGRPFSQAFPLTVNNYIAKAMIVAHDMGEEKITVDVIDAI